MTADSARPTVRFNPFHFLRLERREDILHTPMIVGLLRDREFAPDHRFLRLFLGMLAESQSDVARATVWTNHPWRIESEKTISSDEKGKIDILLTCEALRTAIVIENKIDASEGHLQVEKYARWAQQSYQHCHLYLLSPEGRAAVSHGAYPSRLIGYDQILRWLKDCAPHVKDADFRYVLEAYIDVVRAIIPKPHRAPVGRIEGRLVPSQSGTMDALTFIRNLKTRLDALEELRDLDLAIEEDTRWGKYHAIVMLHKRHARFATAKLLSLRVETLLGNRAHTGVYVGYHWTNTRAGERHAATGRVEALSKLEAYGRNQSWSLNQSAQRNGWVALKVKVVAHKQDEAILATLDRGFDMVTQRAIDRTLGIYLETRPLWLDLNDTIMKEQLG